MKRETIYKATNRDMTCMGHQYELGKTYKEARARMCQRGFHACMNPIETLSYYPLGRVFKCEGVIEDKSNRKVVCSEITFIEEMDMSKVLRDAFNNFTPNEIYNAYGIRFVNLIDSPHFPPDLLACGVIGSLPLKERRRLAQDTHSKAIMMELVKTRAKSVLEVLSKNSNLCTECMGAWPKKHIGMLLRVNKQTWRQKRDMMVKAGVNITREQRWEMIMHSYAVPVGEMINALTDNPSYYRLSQSIAFLKKGSNRDNVAAVLYVYGLMKDETHLVEVLASIMNDETMKRAWDKGNDFQRYALLNGSKRLKTLLSKKGSYDDLFGS